jgi:hypothetical protein
MKGVRDVPRHVFDEIRILRGGRWDSIELDEFLKMPLSTRVRRIIERSIAFYREGLEVDRKDALAELRRLRVSQ